MFPALQAAFTREMRSYKLVFTAAGPSSDGCSASSRRAAFGGGAPDACSAASRLSPLPRAAGWRFASSGVALCSSAAAAVIASMGPPAIAGRCGASPGVQV
eukprot:1111164-Pyramimonas_sp.AAC.1